MHIPGPTVIGRLSQCGNKAIEVARQGYNHELYRQSSVAVSAAALQRNSPQNCSETTLSPVHPPHRFCRKSSPPCHLIAHRRTVPKSPSVEICNVKGAILR
jgi:hypothetical protein